MTRSMSDLSCYRQLTIRGTCQARPFYCRLAFLNPGRPAGPESVGKINLQLHSYILWNHPLSWLRFWPSLIEFALALIGAGSKKIGPTMF